jgi:threonine dehydrogenase-like Zn-dependent dehydrogenase
VKALTWQGKRRIEYADVPDPRIQEPTDAIVRVTSTGICGSDLHLYEVLTPFLDAGDVLGHEAMGVVEETGTAVPGLKPGDRVVVPFNIACGSCFMCSQGLQTQCETTQVRDQGTGAALFGYTKLYGQVPGGLGPIGDMACRIALHRGHRVLGVDLVPERLQRAREFGVETLEYGDGLAERIRDLTDGRGPDSVIEAVGMEAHGSPVARLGQQVAGLLPDAVQRAFMQKAGADRLAALQASVDIVRRGGTISLVGVYGGAADPLPMLTMFDKQVQLRMGQANVRRWSGQILPLLTDDDPLQVDTFATHRQPLADGPGAYEMFQQKRDGAIKVLLQP